MRGNGAGPRLVCKTSECSAQEAMVGSIPTTPLHILLFLFIFFMEYLKNFFSTKSEMAVKEFKDTFPTNRKYAIHFLEYLDSNKITKRIGDVRQFQIERCPE